MKSTQSHNPHKTLLIGAGSMSSSYVKVLRALDIDFKVICRSEASAREFTTLHRVNCEHGGLDQYLKNFEPPSSALVCVGVEDLFSVTKTLILNGVKRILVEKPAVLFRQHLDELLHLQQVHNSSVFIGYNRRFLNSVYALKKRAEEDGGISSLSFDFTEWSDKIEPLTKGPNVKDRWVLSNSSHILDLAFHLIGLPEKMNCFHSGGLSWHPAASNFVGAGVTDRGIPFSFRSDWDSAGRWKICAFTKNHKFELCPVEKLNVTRRNEVTAIEYLNEDTDDEVFKPGLIKQVRAFFDGNDKKELCSLSELGLQYDIFAQIAGYKN